MTNACFPKRSRWRRGTARVASVGALVAGAVGAFVPGTTASAAGYTVAAAGDIACAPATPKDSKHCHQAETAALITTAGASTVIPLGDNQYNSGQYADYMAVYDKSWGKFKSITKPVRGNHDSSSGYQQYFGSAAGPSGKYYYSYNIGSWHVIVLNTNLCASGGCATGSAQETWLKGDLGSSSAACTLAVYHAPRFSSSNTSANTAVDPLWRDLANAHVDLVLNGDKHFYERLKLLNANGNPTTTGTRTIITGTGGASLAGTPTTTNPQRAAFSNKAFGVTFLTLNSGSYSWKFTPDTSSGSFSDSGSSSCH